MSAEQPKNPDPANQGPFTQEIHHPQQVSARVPEKIGRGVFSTGTIVLQGQHEFVIDFLMSMVSPNAVVSRVILPPSVVPQLIAALRENLNNFQTKFGPPPALPTPPPQATPPSLEDLYDRHKLTDDMIGGVYANSAMITHTPSEFCFDFIANFYPRSAVACRVFLSAPQVPGFLNTLIRSFQQYQQKIAAAQQQPKPPSAPPAG